MTTPFHKAKNSSRKLKLFLYGPPGSGKTTLSLQFPKPVVIDMERGTELYAEDFDFDVMPATTPDEVMSAVDWLLANKHEYRTLVIDPITVYWAALQQKWSDIFMLRKRQGAGYKFEFYEFQPRDWLTIKAEMKHLIRKLIALDMNVICTAHQKDKYAKGGAMQIIGETFDGESKIPYYFDVILRLYREGKKFMAMPDPHEPKDRTNKLPTKPFEISYRYFAEWFGEEYLEREATPTPFITDEQKNEIENMIVVLQLTDQQVKGALRKYDAETLDDLTEENAAIVLTNLNETYDKRKKQEATNAEG